MFRFLTKQNIARIDLTYSRIHRWYHGKSPPLCYWWMFFL